MTPTVDHPGSRTLTIDPEFAELCTDLSSGELAFLESSLQAEGCRDPIVSWANHDDTILDGHNRYRICQRLGIPFKTRALTFQTRAEAVSWVIANQLGRRNLSEEQKAYLRGKHYQTEKRQGQRTDLTSGQNDQKSAAGEKLAAEYNVGSRTIRRDAEFAAAVDTIAKAAGPQVRKDILSGQFGVTKRDFVALAELPAEKLRRTIAAGTEAIKTAAYKVRHDRAPDSAKNPTRQREARPNIGQRWHAALQKVYVLLTSTRDVGGIATLAREWAREAKADYITDLRQIVGELNKWIAVLENDE